MSGNKQTFTLLQLNKSIKKHIEKIGTSIWVTAEIARVQEKNGHLYLELVQKKEDFLVAQIKANIWKDTYKILLQKIGEEEFSWIIEEGKEVLIEVWVTFHEVYGMSLRVNDLDLAYTIGEMALRKQMNLKKLQEEGFLFLQKQLIPPKVIQKIAIISSSNAAGLKDFLDQLTNNSYGYKFYTELFEATVQGKNAIQAIQDQLQKISVDEFDAIVLIRGGGAKSDLEIFNHYDLSKTIALTKLPIYCGIGHQIDETIVDIISHKSLKTPTAVASYLIEDMLSYEEKLLQSLISIERTIQNRLLEENWQLDKLMSMIQNQSNQLIQNQLYELKGVEDGLKMKSEHILYLENERLKNIAWRIKEMDPRALFKKGFSLSLINGKKIVEETKINKGDKLETHISGKRLYSTVDKYERG